MKWNVKNAISRDVERQQLNKILEEIEASIDGLREIDDSNLSDEEFIRAVVAEMVSNNSEDGITVAYDPEDEVLNFAVNSFTITLQGDVTGNAEVVGLRNVSITTELDPSLVGVGEAPIDGYPYWRYGGEWQQVTGGLEQLEEIEVNGFTVKQYDSVSGEHTWYLRQLEVDAGELTIVNGDGIAGNPVLGLADVTPGTGGVLTAFESDQFGRIAQQHPVVITGTANQIDVADGDGALGAPTISLADLTDTGTGTFKLITRDAKGRLEGTVDGTTDNVPEGTSNFYFTDDRADARIALQKGQPDGLATLDANAKLQANQLPALAITETFVVADQAAMLALNAQQGDVAVRTDEQKSYILTAEPASTLANWQELLTPTGTGGTVTSVDVAVPSGFTVSGVPITSSGTITIGYAAGYQGYTSAEATKLAGIAAGATVGADWNANLANIPANITSWAGIAPSAKENAIAAGTTAQYWRGDKSWQDLDAAVLEASPPDIGAISGLRLVWNSTTSISATAGAAYIPSLGKTLRVPSTLTASSLVLSANTWYHVYLYDNAGAPAIEVVTTAPVSYAGPAMQKTGDNTRRYVGSIRTTTGGAILNFIHVQDRILYRQQMDTAPFRILAAGLATTETVVSAADVVPLTSHVVSLRVFNLAPSSALQIRDGDGTFYTFNAGVQSFYDMPVSASQTLTYRLTGSPSVGAYLDAVGYTFER